MKISIIVASISCLGFLACGGPDNTVIDTTNVTELTVQARVVDQNVNVEKFKELCAWENVQLLDVRTPNEWAEGIIEGAIKMNFFDESFKDSLNTLKRDEPILVYCKSGGRSGKAMKQLVNLGYSEIYNLEGGITAWNAKGMLVVK
ncbi:MAG: rhodanese-related sulfurtransferase [Flavobacteriales bacterium]|jgi:rhodanese-related sulfurtransferase